VTNRNMKVALPLVTVAENTLFLVSLFFRRRAWYFFSLLRPLIHSDVWGIPSLLSSPDRVTGLKARFADIRIAAACDLRRLRGIISQ